MSDVIAFRRVVSAAMKSAGMVGRRYTWHIYGRDVQWVVHVDRLPYGRRLGVDIGLALHAQSRIRHPTDCPVLLHLENLSSFDTLPILEMLDLNSQLGMDERVRLVDATARRLVDYLRGHSTIEGVRQAFRDGDFRSGFVHRDARAFLAT